MDETLLDGSRLQESIVRACDMIAVGQPGLEAARLVEANNAVWLDYWPEVAEKWTLGARGR